MSKRKTFKELSLEKDLEKLDLSGFNVLIRKEKTDEIVTESVSTERGERGPQGDIGFTGPQGPQGYPGKDGVPGPKGNDGPQGTPGERGPQGDQGERGYTGENGEQGIQGEAGPQGEQGDVGPVGAEGAPGPQGERGPQGDQGERGLEGEKGAEGDRGRIGPRGEQGVQGVQGVQGDTGLQGEQGIQGEVGPSGDQGERGDVGPQGKQGAQGIQGNDGKAGPQGDIGLQGKTGARGKTGPEGPSGAQGDRGEAGLAPEHELRPNGLRFKNPDGSWGEWLLIPNVHNRPEFQGGGIGVTECIGLIEEYGGAGGGACAFDGSPVMPTGNISGLTSCDFVEAFFPSQPPTMDIQGNPTFGFYEIGYDIVNPIISGRGHLGSNPAGLFTNLTLYRGAVASLAIGSTANPNNNSWYPHTDTFTVSTNQQYSGRVTDDQARTATANGNYMFVYPIFATTNVITTYTKQPLVAHNSTYFETPMVAEDAGGNKQTSDFSNLHSAITGVQFFNTVSNQWEWINGGKAASLTSFTSSAVTHVVQGNTVNYTRYEHNSIKVGVRNLRWYTN